MFRLSRANAEKLNPFRSDTPLLCSVCGDSFNNEEDDHRYPCPCHTCNTWMHLFCAPRPGLLWKRLCPKCGGRVSSESSAFYCPQCEGMYYSHYSVGLTDALPCYCGKCGTALWLIPARRIGRSEAFLLLGLPIWCGAVLMGTCKFFSVSCFLDWAVLIGGLVALFVAPIVAVAAWEQVVRYLLPSTILTPTFGGKNVILEQPLFDGEAVPLDEARRFKNLAFRDRLWTVYRKFLRRTAEAAFGSVVILVFMLVYALFRSGIMH